MSAADHINKHQRNVGFLVQPALFDEALPETEAAGKPVWVPSGAAMNTHETAGGPMRGYKSLVKLIEVDARHPDAF